LEHTKKSQLNIIFVGILGIRSQFNLIHFDNYLIKIFFTNFVFGSVL